MQDAIAGLFAILLLACLVGIVIPLGKFLPFADGLRRKHYALGAIASFILFAIVVPEPTPEELAAQEAAEKQEAAEDAAKEHDRIVEKAAKVIPLLSEYTRDEYPETYQRVGAKAFAELNKLEPGAFYAAAESRLCDEIKTGAVSDLSTKGKPIWFVDCENERRFMVDQETAAAALARFEAGKLEKNGFQYTCTYGNLRRCQMTPDEIAAADARAKELKLHKEKEVEYVSVCDMILENVLVSPSSLDTKMWEFGMDDDGYIVVTRPFDSENAFGASLRSTYTCKINPRGAKIDSFTISGPTGTEKVI